MEGNFLWLYPGALLCIIPMGVIVPVIQMGASKDDLAIILYFLTRHSFRLALCDRDRHLTGGSI